MVLIYMNGQDKSDQIKDWKICTENNSDKLILRVEFPSGKFFKRPLDQCVIEPTLECKGNLLHNKKKDIFSVIEKATSYGDKYIVIKYPESDKPYIMESKDAQVLNSPNFKDGEVFSYFTSVAKERLKFTSKHIAENIIRQLERIVPHSATALNAYCFGEVEKRTPKKHLIFPFGLNESQLIAVEAAFSSQISVIEGPPGTGKTQTILNIIANILINGDTVAIVSNNNDAVNNVYEKLEKVNLGYIIAKLGNKSNQENFFQSLIKKDNEDIQDVKHVEEIDELVQKLKKHLHLQNQVAKLKAEINELSVELSYLEKWRNEERPDIKLIPLEKYKFSLRKIVDLMVFLDHQVKTKVSLKKKIQLLFNYKMIRTRFLNDFNERDNFIYSLQFMFYQRLLERKNKKVESYENELKSQNFAELLEDLTQNSMGYLKNYLNETIPTDSINFELDNYKKLFNQFLKRYPILGSGSQSIINAIGQGTLIDYVIMDEASQQEIVSGILSAGCAKNLIVVGDRKQLPHIEIKSDIEPPSPVYDSRKMSFLDSVISCLNEKIPITLLKEHYRCHPKIIQFCNQQFYDNQLIPMTQDKGEQSLELITTSKGNHMRWNANQRELESILEVGVGEEAETSFIAPYNAQINLSEKYLSKDVSSSTIHKVQGKERDNIIFSTVLDNKKSSLSKMDFVDNPHLVNVAVSRAKHKFTLVTGNSVFLPYNQDIAALIRYIQYYADSDQIHESPVISAFDLLYEEYDKSLEKLKAKLDGKDSKFKSEQIIASILKELMLKDDFKLLHFHMHIKLSQLVKVDGNFTKREQEFQKRASCDFVFYYKVGKVPMAVLEVDGGYHDRPIQKERDSVKDSILEKVRIPILRLKTTDVKVSKKIEEFLLTTINMKS
ncbi:AAA domain-containing protein [Bacillus pumilus]|uniref:AAA domain-containing protein n=1 Tax=Bacillus pumilus TaxID=1408 RepID=UPI000D03C6C1|nr:AAA domain-containing protein [Bacillus pumilus]PRS60195.1 helicase [Bacillus pumilus]